MSRKSKGSHFIADVFRKRPFTVVSDLKGTGEISKLLLSNMGAFRSNITEVLSKEVSKVINKVDVSKLLHQVLKDYTIKVEAKIEFQPKSKKGTR